MAGIRDWIMGDMPLKPEQVKVANKIKRRLPTGTRCERESTGRPAPDIIAQAWEWAIGEQPLKPQKPTASNTATVPKSHHGGQQGKKRATQTASAVWDWVKGDQPLEPVKKKQLEETKTAKIKRSDKLATWMRKGKQYGDEIPMQQRSRSLNQTSLVVEDPDRLETNDEQSAGDHHAK